MILNIFNATVKAKKCMIIIDTSTITRIMSCERTDDGFREVWKKLLSQKRGPPGVLPRKILKLKPFQKALWLNLYIQIRNFRYI